FLAPFPHIKTVVLEQIFFINFYDGISSSDHICHCLHGQLWYFRRSRGCLFHSLFTPREEQCAVDVLLLRLSSSH
ncbi:hypothetical protein PMAYCL1PPCAC_10377, partial [Pristionchus mayeri]